ncbi:MAG: type II toxin-antitoxin system PemK/MazF family toxin [Xenococcaceae cyanobacterium]
MARFVKGDVVIVPFPFSDLSQAKRRPALIVAKLAGEDLILCQITSQVRADNYAVAITNADFANGGLNRNSNIRPNRLFTADEGIILYKAGQLKPEKLKEVINKIIAILQG